MLYESVFEFDTEDVAVSAGGGVIPSPGRPFTHGYEVSFEKATVQSEYAGYADGSTALIPVTIMHEDGSVERPDCGEGDPVGAFVAEIDTAARCVDDGQVSPILDARIAADAIKICEMQMT